MVHVQAGDIIFFKASGLVSRLNVLGQSILSRRCSRWSHVALCVHGPLVVHATPRHLNWSSFGDWWVKLTGTPAAGARSNPGAHEGGVHLEILEREFLKGATFTVMRPLSAAGDRGFQDRLQEASTYFLAQQYSFLSIYFSTLRGHAAIAPGQSFCSFLVQQVYAKIGVDPFGGVGRTAETLMPGELFDLLLSDPAHWQMVQPASLDGDENQKNLADIIRHTSKAPDRDLRNLLAPYVATRTTMIVIARARTSLIEYVQGVNRLFSVLNHVEEQLARARAQLPASAVAALIERIQTEIEPQLQRVLPMAVDEPSTGDLLFMNYRSLVSIVVTPKGSWDVTLTDHWKAALGDATLTGPHADKVDRYIANQRAIVEIIALRQGGALSRSLDGRWDLPPDLDATLAVIDGDIKRLDACRLSDWHLPRKQVRELLLRMEDIVQSASAAIARGTKSARGQEG